MFNIRFNWKEPYRWRTNLRTVLPAFLAALISKGKDCEQIGAAHHWYNIDDENSGCYHCQVERPGQLWKRSPTQT